MTAISPPPAGLVSVLMPAREPAGNHSVEGKWAETLRNISDEMERLNREIEGEFVATGKKIFAFIETVGLLSSDLNDLSGAMAGTQGQQAAEALSGSLTLSTEMQTRAAQSGNGLSQLRQESQQVRTTLSGFRTTVATFHSLGVLTRIETARLGNLGADFGTLAEEVRLLARNVHSRVEGALDSAAELIPQIESALSSAAALREGQMQVLPSVIAQAMESLDSFRAVQSKAYDASVRLGGQYTEIALAFQKLVISMQFNDITRQQMEHVIEALRLLSKATRDDGTLLLASRQAADVLQLQASQLANTRETFRSSVDSVLQSLDNIAASVKGMVEESRVLADLSGSDENSFLGQMVRACSTILSTLSHCASIESATSGTSAELAKKIDKMAVAIEEIRGIETQMKYIAMNARISAMQIGAAGEALSALADSIRQRSLESRQGSDFLVETLRSMAELAMQAAASNARTPEQQQVQETCLNGMQTAVVELRSSQAGKAGQIERILARGNFLCQDLIGARKAFSVRERFDRAVNPMIAQLDAVMQDIRLRGSAEGPPSDFNALAEFAGRYTMKSERDVFSSLADGGTASEKSAGSADSSGDDGVEFF